MPSRIRRPPPEFGRLRARTTRRQRLHRRLRPEGAARHGSSRGQASRLERRALMRRLLQGAGSGTPAFSGVWQSAAPSAKRGSARRTTMTGVEDEGATRREQATLRPVELPGHDAGNGRQAPSGRALGQRGEQRRGIGMVRIGEQRSVAFASTCWPAYWTITRSAVSATTPMSWVISTSPMPFSRRSRQQQIEDLRLDGHVERGGRLVGDQQLRPAGERHRDHHALAHAAGELVRDRRDAPLGIGNADLAQAVRRCAAARAPRSRRDGSSALRRSGSRP